MATAKIKAVLFDIGGVLTAQPQLGIAAYGRKLGLPQRFLPELFLQGSPDNSFCKLERGEYTLSEFFPYFELEAKAKAKVDGISLPDQFCASDIFDSFGKDMQRNSAPDMPFRLEMLNAVATLRKHGIKTCAITNNWIDDRQGTKLTSSKFMMNLKPYFNFTIESAKVGVRKPDPRIYTLACSKLQVKPHETVFLDDIGQNLKTASQLGIHCIKVSHVESALKELEVTTGVKLLSSLSIFPSPPPCTAQDLSHGYVETKPGVIIHYVEAGVGPTVILLHGFPDLWYGYRHQIPALACAGFRVIALDQRGYGDSSSPRGIEEYTQQELCGDVVLLMDKLIIPEATVVGHDWGASVAWNLALFYPDRFKGVCGINNPFFPINSSQDPLINMRKNPGVFDYIIYFQKSGIADKELENDVERSMTCLLQGFRHENAAIDPILEHATSSAQKRGGLLAGLPPNIPLSSFLSETDLEMYASQFKKTGFTGPLNWYRNLTENWKWRVPIAKRKITIPALMVTSSHDPVLKPEFSFGMEKRVPLLERLHLENCGHWALQEKPEELNAGLIKWLHSIHNIKSQL